VIRDLDQVAALETPRCWPQIFVIVVASRHPSSPRRIYRAVECIRRTAIARSRPISYVWDDETNRENAMSIENAIFAASTVAAAALGLAAVAAAVTVWSAFVRSVFFGQQPFQQLDQLR
jgi:hypothetical protein